MGGLYKSILNLKYFRLSAFIVLVIVGAIVYFNFVNSEPNDSSLLSEDEELHSVGLGDVRRQISINGRLVFPTKEALDFGSQGVVTEISVVEGQLVTKGDLLAKLDGLTIKGLERDVAKSALDLQLAQDLLEEGHEGTSDLDRAQLQETLARAAVEVRDAEEGLEEANDPYSVESIRSKEQSLIEARMTLRDNVQALEQRYEDHALVYAKLVKDKDAAEVTLEAATDALGQLDIDHAELLAETNRSRNNLEISVEKAAKELKTYKERNPLWSEWVKEKDAALDALRSAQDKLDHILAIIYEMPGLDHKITHWKFVIPIRQEDYDSARAKLFELERLESDLSLEQARLNAANKLLAELLLGVDSTEKSSWVSSVQFAQADLSVSVKHLSDKQAELPELDEALLEVAIKHSSAQVNLLEEDLEDMLTGADSLVVDLRIKQLELAKAELADADDQLSESLVEPDHLEIALLESDVNVSAETLRDANKKLGQAILRAPFSGIISKVHVVVGDSVGSQAPILEISDPATTEIEGLVDEIDILSIGVGSKVDLAFDAMPNRRLEGRLTSINATPEVEQTVVSYPVRISVRFPPRVVPREGLSTVANIIIQEEKNVIRMPQQGLRGSFDNPLVRVKTPEGFEDRSISISSTDGYWVAIRDGLNLRDQIIIPSLAANTSQFNFRQIRGQFGGQGPGNGQRPPSGRRGGGNR